MKYIEKKDTISAHEYVKIHITFLKKNENYFNKLHNKIIHIVLKENTRITKRKIVR